MVVHFISFWNYFIHSEEEIHLTSPLLLAFLHGEHLVPQVFIPAVKAWNGCHIQRSGSREPSTGLCWSWGSLFFFENYRDVWGSKFWILNSSNCMGNFSHFIFRLSITYKVKAKPRCFKPGSMDVTAPKWQQCVDKLCHVPLWCLPLRDQWSATCFGFLPLWCWWLRVIFDTCYACNQWIE